VRSPDLSLSSIFSRFVTFPDFCFPRFLTFAEYIIFPINFHLLNFHLLFKIVVFVDKMGTMFLGGPPLVEAATGEKVTAEELGGAMLHSSVSGCADYFARDEEESAAYVRSIFETLNIPGLK
jgi:hypothetical protein